MSVRLATAARRPAPGHAACVLLALPLWVCSSAGRAAPLLKLLMLAPCGLARAALTPGNRALVMSRLRSCMRRARAEGGGLTRAPAGQGAVPSMEEGRQQNAGYLSASAAAERLQRNVQREHSLCTDFLLAFWQARP